jgi:hypothetical protein
MSQKEFSPIISQTGSKSEDQQLDASKKDFTSSPMSIDESNDIQ